ncbi:DUF6868 family protein [Planctomycetes bacterium K23_9]|uniref:DUF6868 domain-containing protein n=1 Tax=Stieleria marina TaxID=1930275 RepID=A0A517NTB9_9BACT|nr:hypothetical protein K239x_23240 [Planctomycetes bacterium K23_9]
MPDSNKVPIQQIESFLLRCWLIGFGFLLLIFVVQQLMAGTVYQIHQSLFDLSSHELDVIFYCAMGLIKLFVLVFFLIPWLALKSMPR